MMLNSSVERGNSCFFPNFMVKATSPSPFWDSGYIHIKLFDTVPQLLDILLFYSNTFFSSLCFSLSNFCCSIFKITDSFFSCVESTWKLLKAFSISVSMFLFTALPFDSFLYFPSVLKFFYMIFHVVHLFHEGFNMVMVILSYFSDISNICSISEYGSIDCIASWWLFLITFS